MNEKLLIPLYGNDVAPRFDLASEVLVLVLDENGKKLEEKIVVMPQFSAEKICHLIITENIRTVICGAIEDEYYQYLVWKRVQVFDSVIGPWETVVERFTQGRLESGSIAYRRRTI